jgi:hypothetical protein
MFYRPYPHPDADTQRAAAIAAAVAARGTGTLSQELGEAEHAVLVRDEFSESARRIGLLLGFDATSTGSNVHWTIHEDGNLAGGSWVIAGPNEVITNELAGAAGRLRELLGELRWRTVLPGTFVSFAIARGFARHDLDTTGLLERLTTDAV